MASAEITRTATTNTACIGSSITDIEEICRDECLDWQFNETSEELECYGGYGEICRINNVSRNYFTCTKSLHSGITNYYDTITQSYEPINTSIKTSDYQIYAYEMTQGIYEAYFRNNSNTGEPVRFEKEGYFFVYDISGGDMIWAVQDGKPAATDTLGGGAPSNSQDTQIVVSDNKAVYPGAFYNTNVTYHIYNEMLKETFILSGLPSFKDYHYLQYSGNIKFNRSLQICTETQCFIPSGTQDDFETSGKIYFKDMSNNTIFYLTEPTITDANGNEILGIYKVHGSDAQMNFWLRINKTFLESAAYPVRIDPTIVLQDADTENLGDSTLVEGVPDTNFGSDVDFHVRNSSIQVLWGLIMFELSSLPSGIMIDNANLSLYSTYIGVALDIGVYDIYNTYGWNETTVTWNLGPTQGVDFNETPSNTSYVAMGTEGWHTWNVTRLVEDALDDGQTNVSFLLKSLSETAEDDDISFDAKEVPTTTTRPVLNVTYTEISNITISDCTILDEEDGQYFLTSSIIDSSTPNCMDITANNVTLDCRGNKIDGNGSVAIAIRVYPASDVNSNVTIRNCTINEFSSQIYIRKGSNNLIRDVVIANGTGGYDITLYESSDNTLFYVNSTGNSNTNGLFIGLYDNNVINMSNISGHGSDYNIRIINSDNTIMQNVTTQNADYTDIFFTTVSSTDCTPGITMTNVIGTGGNPIVFYNSGNIIDWNNNVSQIIMCDADDSVINNVTIDGGSTNNQIGIYATQSDDLNITSCNLTRMNRGILIQYGGGEFIANNSITSMENDGISYGLFSGAATIANNTIENVGGTGIRPGSENNMVINNTVRNATIGIEIGGGSSNYGTSVINNTIRDCDEGIELDYHSSAYTYFHNNFLNNTLNIDFDGSSINPNHTWNTTKTTGNPIFGTGTELGGNFWAAPSGNGFSERCTDSNTDGFCDFPYNISTNTTCTQNVDCGDGSTDYLALSNKYNSIKDLDLEAPEDNNWTNISTPIFTFNYTGEENVSNCTLWLNSTPYGRNDSVVNYTTTSLTANASVNDGNYAWFINCTDSYGNIKKSSERNIGIDTGNSTVTIISPANNNYTSDVTPSFIFNVSDNVSTSFECWLYINSTNVAYNGSVINATDTTLTSNATLNEGSHDYNITCFDQANNMNATTKRYVTVDTTVPNVLISRPSGGNWTNNKDPNFFFVPKDIINKTMNCELIINGTGYGMNTSTINNTLSNITANVSLPDNTNYSWYISCEDNIRSRNTTPRQIHVDTTNPIIVKAATLNLTTAYYNHTFTCNFTISDNLGPFKLVNFSWYINSTYQKYNNITIPLINNTEYQTLSFSGNHSRNDNVSCNLTVMDNANNIITSGDTITISNTPPIVDNVSIAPSPADSTSTLNCTYDYWDPDGDSHIATSFNWTINGVLTTVHQQNLSAGNTSVGDVVNCSVGVYDGFDNSTDWSYSPSINLSDGTPPVMNGTMLSAVSGDTTGTYYIYTNCSDATSSLMANYPKVTFDQPFAGPGSSTQGNFTMILVTGNQYNYPYTFGIEGVYENFTFYCRDAQNNLVMNDTNSLFFSSRAPTGSPGGGGGTVSTTTTVIREANLTAFCGDGTCGEGENPFSCSQDCRVNLETALTCIWEDPKSCIYNRTWFAAVILIFLLASAVFIIYKVESKKEPRWMKKWF